MKVEVNKKIQYIGKYFKPIFNWLLVWTTKKDVKGNEFESSIPLTIRGYLLKILLY